MSIDKEKLCREGTQQITPRFVERRWPRERKEWIEEDMWDMRFTTKLIRHHRLPLLGLCPFLPCVELEDPEEGLCWLDPEEGLWCFSSFCCTRSCFSSVVAWGVEGTTFGLGWCSGGYLAESCVGVYFLSTPAVDWAVASTLLMVGKASVLFAFVGVQP